MELTRLHIEIGTVALFIFLEYFLPNFSKQESLFKRKYLFDDTLYWVVNLSAGLVFAAYGIKFLYHHRDDISAFQIFHFSKKAFSA